MTRRVGVVVVLAGAEEEEEEEGAGGRNATDTEDAPLPATRYCADPSADTMRLKVGDDSGKPAFGKARPTTFSSSFASSSSVVSTTFAAAPPPVPAAASASPRYRILAAVCATVRTALPPDDDPDAGAVDALVPPFPFPFPAPGGPGWNGLVHPRGAGTEGSHRNTAG